MHMLLGAERVAASGHEEQLLLETLLARSKAASLAVMARL